MQSCIAVGMRIFRESTRWREWHGKVGGGGGEEQEGSASPFLRLQIFSFLMQKIFADFSVLLVQSEVLISFHLVSFLIFWIFSLVDFSVI